MIAVSESAQRTTTTLCSASPAPALTLPASHVTTQSAARPSALPGCAGQSADHSTQRTSQHPTPLPPEPEPRAAVGALRLCSSTAASLPPPSGSPATPMPLPPSLADLAVSRIRAITAKQPPAVARPLTCPWPPSSHPGPFRPSELSSALPRRCSAHRVESSSETSARFSAAEPVTPRAEACCGGGLCRYSRPPAASASAAPQGDQESSAGPCIAAVSPPAAACPHSFGFKWSAVFWCAEGAGLKRFVSASSAV